MNQGKKIKKKTTDGDLTLFQKAGITYYGLRLARERYIAYFNEAYLLKKITSDEKGFYMDLFDNEYRICAEMVIDTDEALELLTAKIRRLMLAPLPCSFDMTVEITNKLFEDMDL